MAIDCQSIGELTELFVIIIIIIIIIIALFIADIEYVGNASYEVLKPILERCSSSQLYTIEEYNPVSFISLCFIMWVVRCFLKYFHVILTLFSVAAS